MGTHTLYSNYSGPYITVTLGCQNRAFQLRPGSVPVKVANLEAEWVSLNMFGVL